MATSNDAAGCAITENHSFPLVRVETAPPKIGAVTVTYNSGRVISQFLACLQSQTYRNVKTYIVDNASSDDTLARIAAADVSSTTLIDNKSNRGFAEGCNQGIRRALADGCDLVLLINNDTEFGPELLNRLEAELTARSADIVAPKIAYFSTQNRIWFAGGELKMRRGYSGEHYGLGLQDSGGFDVPRQISFLPFCCALMRKEVFSKVGYLDGRYFAYFEDVDFCYRAASSGMRLWYTPAATLYHKVGSLSGGEKSAFFLRHNTRNHVYFLLKNLGARGAMFLPAYQALLVYKWISRKYSTSSFGIVERAFWEGVHMFWTSRESQVGD